MNKIDKLDKELEKAREKRPVPSSGLCLLYAAQVLDRGVLPLLP